VGAGPGSGHSGGPAAQTLSAVSQEEEAATRSPFCHNGGSGAHRTAMAAAALRSVVDVVWTRRFGKLWVWGWLPAQGRSGRDQARVEAKNLERNRERTGRGAPVFNVEQRWQGDFLRWLSDTKNWRGTSVYICVGREGLEEGEQSLVRAAPSDDGIWVRCSEFQN
jgi:hypothetical protein